MAGGKRLKPALPVTLKDETAERARRNHAERIDELQSVPIVRGKLIAGVSLPDGDEVSIHHGLGRRASVFPAVPLQGDFTATNGRLLDITLLRSDKVDVRQYSVLKASGFGGTLTLDVWVI
jgi:hypothetical protein